METITRELIKTVVGAPGEHPGFSAEGCLNRRQRRYPCTVCAEQCPAGVFSLKAGEQVRWDRCTDCEVCLAACPARCFTPSPSALRLWREGAQPGRSFSLSCLKESALTDRTVRCLAGVPWELLALYALEAPVTLYAGGCAACEHTDWAKRVEATLHALRDFLGEALFAERVRLAAPGETPAEDRPEPEREVTRREMFAGVKTKLVQSAGRAALKRLPLPGETDGDGLRYRRALAEAVLRRREDSPAGSPPRWGLTLPRFTTGCYGCGVCEKLCPHKALAIGPEQDGRRMIYITPFLCTGCGLCVKACPHGGLAGLGAVPVPDLRRLPLVRIPSGSCRRCGAAVPPGQELCPSCAAKDTKMYNKKLIK